MDKSGGDVAKRGRGRPRKVQSNAKSANESSSAKSKKVKFTGSTKKMSGDMKLARMAKNVADAMEKTKKVAKPVKTANGNSGSTNKKETSPDKDSNVVQKRGRGRPRKDASLIVTVGAKLPAKLSAGSSGQSKRKLGDKMKKPHPKQTKRNDGTGKIENRNKKLYKK